MSRLYITRRLCYHTFISLLILLIWRFCGARNRDKLELLNKRNLRFIFNDINSSYDELLKKAKTSSLYGRRIYQHAYYSF